VKTKQFRFYVKKPIEERDLGTSRMLSLVGFFRFYGLNFKEKTPRKETNFNEQFYRFSNTEAGY